MPKNWPKNWHYSEIKLKKRIGFIGLGIMGKALAKNLIAKGFKISVYNRTREKTKEFSDLGCSVAATAKELAQISNTVITMVENDEALENILYGPIGVFSGSSHGTYLINMSTISRDLCIKIAESCFEKGIKFLDSPVAGSKPLAEKGTLVILCGAKKEDIEENKDLLYAMGKTIINPGPPPAGTSLKLCVNILLAQMTIGLCESAVLAEKLSLDPSFIFETIKNSPALDCGYFRMKENNILNKDFTPAFSVKNMLKDLNYAEISAKSKQINLKGAHSAQEIFLKAFKEGFYNEDLTAVLKTIKG